MEHQPKILLIGKHSKDKQFEKLLKEIFPTEIPVRFVREIVVEFLDGTSTSLNHNHINAPLPIDEDRVWRDLISAFENVNQITVIVDIGKINKSVNHRVADLLDAHFE